MTLHAWALLALFTLGTIGLAQQPQSKPKPPTLKELERVKVLDQLLTKAEELRVLADRVNTERRTKCLMAVGSAPFCDCLADNLPVSVSFPSYVEIVTSSKDELGYPSLPPDNRALVDNVYAARESCVGKVFGIAKP